MERLDKGISDHCPQLIRFESGSSRKWFFKFYNVLVDHEHFELLVRENWESHRSHNLLKDVWKNCMSFKSPLKSLNTQWFMKTSERIDGIRHQLQLVQHNLSLLPIIDLIHEEKKVISCLGKME